MAEKIEPGALLTKQKRKELIATCPLKRVAKKHRHFCITCPLKPWCKPDKEKGQ